MPKRLKRYYGQGLFHFVTFSCHRRLPFLGAVRARNLFVKTLGEVRRSHMKGGKKPLPSNCQGLCTSDPSRPPAGHALHASERTDSPSVLYPRKAFRAVLAVVEFAAAAGDEHFHLVFDP